MFRDALLPLPATTSSFGEKGKYGDSHDSDSYEDNRERCQGMVDTKLSRLAFEGDFSLGATIHSLSTSSWKFHGS